MSRHFENGVVTWDDLVPGFHGPITQLNMADDKAELAAKKAAELDKELDEYIESLKKKAGGKKRETGFTEENWQEVRMSRVFEPHTCLDLW